MNSLKGAYSTIHRDIVLCARKFNSFLKFLVCDCSCVQGDGVRNFYDNLFYGYYALYVPFVVCLVAKRCDHALMKPCHFKIERPFTDKHVDALVFESDKYVLRKLFFLPI